MTSDDGEELGDNNGPDSQETRRVGGNVSISEVQHTGKSGLRS